MGYITFTREGRMFGIIEGDSRKASQTYLPDDVRLQRPVPTSPNNGE